MTSNISNELQVYRLHNGIGLRKPIGLKHSVGDILKLPLAIYFEDRNGVIQKANALNAEACCGFDSPEQAAGKKYFTYIKKNDAARLRNNDEVVIKKNSRLIFEEAMTQEDGSTVSTLSIKLPWYNNKNNIIGLFGCSILLGKSPLGESLRYISDLGLLTPNEEINNFVGREINDVYLSKREFECAKLLLQGLKIKEIAAHLNLSPRTVESYFNNMKSKLHCQSRTDFIIKLSEYIKN
jgi:DNA-binding CsgD family transcriptional regulator